MDIRIPPADLSVLQYATYSGPEAVPLREGYSHRVRKGRCGKVAAFERVSASNSPPQRRSRGTASFRRGTPPFPAKWRGMAAKIGSTNSLKPLRPIFSSSRAEEGKADAVAAAGWCWSTE